MTADTKCPAIRRKDSRHSSSAPLIVGFWPAGEERYQAFWQIGNGSKERYRR
jgi:hypothetical protein